MSESFDVVVIGSGPGGYSAAIRCAQRGASVAVAEKGFMGGTCLNCGCIPSKTLLASAHTLLMAKHAAMMGIDIAGASPNWAKIQGRKDAVVGGFRKGLTGLIQANKIRILAGRAVVDDFLLALGWSPGEYAMVDGSGMSRENRFTPRHFTLLLVHMYEHPLAREWLGTLPASGGVEGRWRKRLAEPGYRGAALRGVRCSPESPLPASGAYPPKPGAGHGWLHLPQDLCPTGRGPCPRNGKNRQGAGP